MKQADGRWISAINGTEYSQLEVDKAKSLYGNGGVSAAQTAINYEVGKVANGEQEYERFLNHSPALLSNLGINDGEVKGIMQGVGYNNQAKRLDLKHRLFERQEDGSWTSRVDHAPFAQDAAENFGTYPLANMKTSPITALEDAYDSAEKALRTGKFRRLRFQGQSSARWECHNGTAVC